MAELIFFSGLMLSLGIGGFIADYIFPHIKPLMRYIDRLPMLEDYEDDLMEETDISFLEESV